MQFLIGKKEHTLDFGLGFGRELNKHYFQNIEGNILYDGVERTVMNLLSQDFVTIIDTIKFAMPTKVSENLIADAVNLYAEEKGGLKPLCDELIEGLKTGVSTKAKVVPMMVEIEKAMKEAEAGK